jgi:hypothetical protein
MRKRDISAVVVGIGTLIVSFLSPKMLSSDERFIIITATAEVLSVAALRPTDTPTAVPTVTPTPTLDLSSCTAQGCASGSSDTAINAAAGPMGKLLLLQEPPQGPDCNDCRANQQISPSELAAITSVDGPTLSLLRTIAASGQTYEVSSGIVYIVDNNTHHIVLDLEEPGYKFRNIVSGGTREELIVPSFCMSQTSLIITDADYYGLNGSNKTETGRAVFFHPAWSALYKIDNRFDIDVLSEETYGLTEISWGGGPIFIWNGAYQYNPKFEWFTPENLIYYETTQQSAISAALSRNRKYLILTVSYGLTLKQHAEQIISLGARWGIEVEKAIRFDGGSSTYLAVRLNDKVVPVLGLQEPKIANCFVVERE